MARKYGRSTRRGQRRTTKRAPRAALARAFPKSPRVNMLQQALTRARSSNRNLRRNGANPKAAQALGMGTYGGAIVVAGGGAVAGVVGELFPAVMGLDTRLIAGAGLVVWGAMADSKASHIGAAMGSGMLACYVEDIAAGVVSGEGFTIPFLTTEEEAA